MRDAARRRHGVGAAPARRAAVASWVAVAAMTVAATAQAQERPALRVRGGGAERTLSVATGRGYAAVPLTELAAVGWAGEATPYGARLSGPGGVPVDVSDGSPFLRWDDQVLQLTDPPYIDGGSLHIPLQFFTDFLPWKMPEAYGLEPAARVLTWTRGEAPVMVASVPSAGADTSATPAPGEPSSAPAAREAVGKRMVFIDPGHGGEDPGTMSRNGIREKNVALGIGRAMAAALARDPDLEVVLIRSDDTYVPPWDRGARATELKGERHGVFVSLHANSVPNRNSTARGFETYFLSEARTEHERRVAAIENAPLGVSAAEAAAGGDLDFILRELKNLDQQHWSSLLAEFVQEEVDRVHPGPNRGVKQAPLAVITNAIMPAVLVEIGYLSHPEEARLLADEGFQKEAGEAIAEAVRRFFQRYPPGSG